MQSSCSLLHPHIQRAWSSLLWSRPWKSNSVGVDNNLDNYSYLTGWKGLDEMPWTKALAHRGTSAAEDLGPEDQRGERLCHRSQWFIGRT